MTLHRSGWWCNIVVIDDAAAVKWLVVVIVDDAAVEWLVVQYGVFVDDAAVEWLEVQSGGYSGCRCSEVVGGAVWWLLWVTLQ